jgi:Protein of unknown function (DUF2924)
MSTSDTRAQSGEGAADCALLSIAPPAPSETIPARLHALETMDHEMLRAEWRRLYRALPPKRVARELLLLGVAWKLQEQALGGLGAATKRLLAALTQSLGRQGDVKRNRVVQLKPGAKLVREWHGSTHTVLVLEEGFEWRGKRWRSLSEIAQAISGAHWSGPRFFGLIGKGRRQPQEAGHG